MTKRFISQNNFVHQKTFSANFVLTKKNETNFSLKKKSFFLHNVFHKEKKLSTFSPNISLNLNNDRTKKTKIMTNNKIKLWRLKNSKCDQTQNENLTTYKSNCDQFQIVRKLKILICDVQKKWWQNSKTKTVTKLRKIKLWQDLKTQIAWKLNSNCDKTQKLEFC